MLALHTQLPLALAGQATLTQVPQERMGQIQYLALLLLPAVALAPKVQSPLWLVAQAVALKKVVLQGRRELQTKVLRVAMALALVALAEAVAVAVQEQLALMAHPLLVVPVVRA